MAVPGPVGHPAFKGTNRLVRDGAQVILGVEDAALSLGVPYPARGKAQERRSNPRNRSGGRPADPPGPDAAVLRLCRRQAMTPDGIALEAGLAVSEVLEALARLETAGCVSRCSGARFLAAREGAT
jgi:predicted Rossmann fold nucleotide-binding protein DprA/Smf involved in DNA uptake